MFIVSEIDRPALLVRGTKDTNGNFEYIFSTNTQHINYPTIPSQLCSISLSLAYVDYKSMHFRSIADAANNNIIHCLHFMR